MDSMFVVKKCHWVNQIKKLNHVAWGVVPLSISMKHAIEISDFMKVRDFIRLAHQACSRQHVTLRCAQDLSVILTQKQGNVVIKEIKTRDSRLGAVRGTGGCSVMSGVGCPK